MSTTCCLVEHLLGFVDYFFGSIRDITAKLTTALWCEQQCDNGSNGSTNDSADKKAF
jgi:hypothetical protein